MTQQADVGPEVTIFVFDDAGSLASARSATEEDEEPFIESEVEPRIGAVPGATDQLRVLWGGGVCDTTYTVRITTNPDGGPHLDVRQGPMSSSVCDTLGLRRGVVLTFKAPVDAAAATGTFDSAFP